MQLKRLRPEQIITLKDYPLYNQHILKIYFRVFSKCHGNILPPCPVIHKSSGIPFSIDNDVKSIRQNALLSRFMENNPKAEYFLLDGSHKTTAACLSRKTIPVLVIEKDEDLEEAKKLTDKGELFGWYSIENSVEEAVSVLSKHHSNTKIFMTVKDKTNLLVKNKDVPDYIISYYKKHK
ncbi:MAG: hypothetical protein ACMXYL_01620 [Candidatus Woesearchaeota archaeon]